MATLFSIASCGSPLLSPPAHDRGHTPAHAQRRRWDKTNVTVTLTATSAPNGVAVQGLTYSATGATSLSSTTITGSTASITLSARA